MKITIQKKIGSSTFTFEVEEQNKVNALFEAGTLASTPTVCDICGSVDVGLQGSKAKGYTFVKVVCNKCRAQAGLGQYKEGGFFWKRFEKQDFQTQQGDSKGEIPVMEEEEYPQ